MRPPATTSSLARRVEEALALAAASVSVESAVTSGREREGLGTSSALDADNLTILGAGNPGCSGQPVPTAAVTETPTPEGTATPTETPTL